MEKHNEKLSVQMPATRTVKKRKKKKKKITLETLIIFVREKKLGRWMGQRNKNIFGTLPQFLVSLLLPMSCG